MTISKVSSGGQIWNTGGILFANIYWQDFKTNTMVTIFYWNTDF